MTDLQLHSTEDLINEIVRRTESRPDMALAFAVSFRDESDLSLVGQRMIHRGSIHQCYGLATELRHRIGEILLSDLPADD